MAKKLHWNWVVAMFAPTVTLYVVGYICMAYVGFLGRYPIAIGNSVTSGLSFFVGMQVLAAMTIRRPSPEKIGWRIGFRVVLSAFLSAIIVGGSLAALDAFLRWDTSRNIPLLFFVINGLSVVNATAIWTVGRVVCPDVAFQAETSALDEPAKKLAV